MDILPLVSVIIPVYNTEKYVETSVLSVLNQSYKNIEIIIVVDGSPDNAYCVCQKLQKEYSNINVVKHEINKGLSATRNTGISLAKGEYLLFLDSDDTLLPDAVKDMMAISSSHDFDAIYPEKYVRKYMSSGDSIEKRYFDEKCCFSTPLQFASDVIIERSAAWGTTAILYKRSVIYDNSLQFIVGITAEDILFNLEFLKYAKKISFYNNPAESILKRENSITNSYRANFEKNLIFIYEACVSFLKEIGISERETAIKASSMLCRSVIVHVVDTMSAKNKSMKYFKKVSTVKTMLKNNTILNAFNIGMKDPYVTRKSHKVFFRMMYLLIRCKVYGATCLLAYFTSKMVI